MLVKYARKERTTDFAPGTVIEYDVQLYDDPQATKPYGRFMWYQRKPRQGQKTAVVNGFRWNLEWLEPAPTYRMQPNI